jgi:hypothetical protein
LLSWREAVAYAQCMPPDPLRQQHSIRVMLDRGADESGGNMQPLALAQIGWLENILKSFACVRALDLSLSAHSALEVLAGS